MKDKTNVYSKLLAAQGFIKNLDVSKAGRNSYSNYDYFTPEQVSNLVNLACQEVNLVAIYNIANTDNSEYLEATLKVVDTENPEDFIEFKSITAIPSLKATNHAQQIGGAITYSQRYLKMTAFDIQDNTLDFDSQDQRPKTKHTKKTLSSHDFEKLMDLEIEKFKKYYKDYRYSEDQQKQIDARLKEVK